MMSTIPATSHASELSTAPPLRTPRPGAPRIIPQAAADSVIDATPPRISGTSTTGGRTMRLTPEEEAMLAGARGEAVRDALAYQLRVGEFFGA